MEQIHDISRLISRRVLQLSLTPEENERLDAWLSEPNNARLFDEISKLHDATEIQRLQSGGYGEDMANQWAKNARTRWAKISRWFYVTGAAAVVAAVVWIGADFINKGQNEQESTLMAQQNLLPGSRKAVIILSSGIRRDLAGQSAEQIDKMLAHADWATIEVPRGGEYHHTLADGTQVWLNSQSSLRFPSRFDGQGNRNVTISGEAYFDVAKDASHPFVVTTSRGDIRVLGTTFNITDYAGEPLRTVLVTGSVSYTSPIGKERKITPSQMLTYDDKTGDIDVRHVDTSVYTSWIEHTYVFRDQSLDLIMATLARWYDFTPVFKDPKLKKLRFSGRLDRGEEINQLLDAYENVEDVEFRVHGKTIEITNAK